MGDWYSPLASGKMSPHSTPKAQGKCVYRGDRPLRVRQTLSPVREGAVRPEAEQPRVALPPAAGRRFPAPGASGRPGSEPRRPPPPKLPHRLLLPRPRTKFLPAESPPAAHLPRSPTPEPPPGAAGARRPRSGSCQPWAGAPGAAVRGVRSASDCGARRAGGA